MAYHRNMKAIFFITVFFFSTLSFADDVKYSEALDVLLFVDGLAGVQNSESYISVLSEEQKATLANLASDLSAYKEMRVRLQRKQVLDSKIWGEVVVEKDLLIPLFAEAKSVDDALKRTVALYKKDEKKQFEQLLIKIKPLITTFIAQGAAHQKMAKDLRRDLKKSGFFKKVDQAIKLLALQGSKKQKIMLYLTWNKAEEEMALKTLGPVIVLSLHPSKLKELKDFDEVLYQVFQKYPAYLTESAQQLILQAFKDHCPFPEGIDRHDMLTRPLAWALSQIDPKAKIVPVSPVHTISPWIEVYSQMLLPALMLDIKERRNLFTGQWIPRAVKSCDQLMAMSSFFNAVR
ncbi:MAG: hypothetical protein COW00_09730 [Bdellovibrio sp. CG12_big_fil_rev_8_21_14_0_65_39_13]|nr:MAG: hypothetical protein COW00_09730 [Bdellovibrio sp. CG12_big_fil_rev_8_21_14_0_65_39_13]PJB52782.1 MAG: hypothetical protein CO099_10755 [Bdellovibrio sp. CG_4_9_14_3_um_filter_39_7]